MKTPDLLELATRNLRQSMLRNLLTTIGISVGVASLVSMMSLGIGLQRMISQRLERVGFNLLTVSTRGNLPPAGPVAALNAGVTEDRPLDDAALQEIRKLNGVIEAYPDYRFGGEVGFRGQTRSRGIVAIPQSVKTTDDFNNVKGSFFTSDDAAEAMVEKGVAANLLGKEPQQPAGRRGFGLPPAVDAGEMAKELVGQELELNYSERQSGSTNDTYSVASGKKTLKVVGVLDIDQQSRYASFRGGIFVPLGFAQKLHVLSGNLRPGAAQSYQIVMVRLKDAGQVQSAEDAVKKMGFIAFSIQDAMRSLRQGFAIFDIFLGVFGSLALAVASIGIVNTLVMAILERRREIGIMKAVGASDSEVKRVFFAEAGAMGVLGGAIGVILGWLIGRIINAGTNFYLTRQGAPHVDIWYVSWWLIAGAIGFSLVVSLMAGWYPASRASKLDPVEALRYQ
jgi:putative ABC transport system permease protein